MNNAYFDFVNPGFDAASSAHCSLYVLLGTEGCSLAVFGKNNVIQALKRQNFQEPGLHFREVETALRAFLGGERLFSYAYAGIHCAFSNSNTTLVPRRLFSADDLPDYFKLLLRPAEYGYFHDPLPELDCYLTYAVDPLAVQFCRQYFPQAGMSHIATSLLQTWRASAPTDEHRVFLNTRHQFAQIAVFDRQNLLYYNSFQFKKPSDLLYFALLAYDQFRLSAELTPLDISGLVAGDDENGQLLHRYIRSIRDARLPGDTHLSEGIEGLPEQTFFDLFSLLYRGPQQTQP